MLSRKAAVAGRAIISFLNHGAADVTAAAWQRAAGSAAGNMHQLARTAQLSGHQIEAAMGAAAHRSTGMLARLGASVGGLGRAGFAIGGAIGAAGFAAQSVASSLSTLGLLDEQSSAAITRVMELFSIVGALGGVVMPLLGAAGSALGAVAGLVATVGGAIVTFLVSPVGLATAAVVGGLLLLNSGLKEFFGIDLLAPIVEQFSQAAGAISDLIRQPLSEAADWIAGKWQALADRFGPILMPIVQPALAVAQQLINALNHNPTEVIPAAWEGAVKRVASWLSGLPVVGQLVGGQLTDIFSPSKIFGSLLSGLQGMVETIKSSGLGRFLGGNVLKSLQAFMAGFQATGKVAEEQMAPAMLDVTAALERAQRLAKWGGATPESVKQLQALQAQSFVSPVGENQFSAGQLAVAERDPRLATYVQAGVATGNADSTLEAFSIASHAVIAGRTEQVQSAIGAVADEWRDRWNHLERTGTTNVEALFRPGMAAVRNNFAILGGDTADFARRAGKALVTLNFGELKQSLLDYAGNFGHAARAIVGGYGSMQLSALAFGAYSLLSLGPVVLGLGAVAFGVYAVMTNCLGLRNILFGLAKMLVGTVQALFAVLKTAYQVSRGILTILGGIRAALRGDFAQIRAGAAIVWAAIRTGALDLKAALGRIFGGLRQLFQGIFEALRQMVELFVGSIRERINGIAAAFRLIRGTVNLAGNALIAAVSRPRQIWQGFLDLLNRVRTTVKGVVNAVGDSAVGRTARAIGMRVTGRASSLEQARAVIDFDARLAGKEPAANLTLGDRMGLARQNVRALFGGWFGRRQHQPVAPAAAPAATTVQPQPVNFRQRLAQVRQEAGGMRHLAAQTSGVFNDLGAALGVFAPALSGPLFAVTSLVDGVMSLSSTLPQLGSTLVSLFPALGGLSGWFTSAALSAKAFFVSAMSGSLTLGGSMAAVWGALTATFAAVKAAAIGAWAAISGPLLPLIAVIGAVVAGGFLLYQAFKRNFLGIGDLVSGIVDSFKLFWALLVGGVREIVGGVLGTLLVEVRAIGRAFARLGAALIDPFRPLLELFGIRGGGRGLLAAGIHLSVKAILQPLRATAWVLSLSLKTLSWIVQGAIQVGSVVVRAILRPLRVQISLLRAMASGVIGTGQAVWQFMVAPFETLWQLGQGLWQFFTTAAEGVQQLGQTIIDVLLMPFRALWGMVQQIFAVLSGPLRQLPLVGQAFQPPAASPVQRFATGGRVRGSGGGDRVPALLTPGEFVVNAAASHRNIGFLEAINQGVPVESVLKVMPMTPPLMVMPPAIRSARTRDPVEALEQASIQIEINIANINLGEGSGAEAANEFVQELSPRLKQAIKEMLREEVELSRAV